jgi:hypothetical protein
MPGVEVVVRTQEIPEGATHWSKHSGAGQAGRDHGDQRAPDLAGVRAAAVADGRVQDLPDPLLIDKIRDVVGLYLAPSVKAAVFAVDEKPQIQALQRTAPVLPMIPETLERRSFDYVRHGTIDPFAVTDTATGKVIGRLSAQHRAVDFPDFLDEIDPQPSPAWASR